MTEERHGDCICSNAAAIPTAANARGTSVNRHSTAYSTKTMLPATISPM